MAKFGFRAFFLVQKGEDFAGKKNVKRIVGMTNKQLGILKKINVRWKRGKRDSIGKKKG